ncbi:MAG TPA: M23 family metallopeptidase [Gemmatimonadales bacterium]|nr:M23 family metallopeptidase [Gemmatimonadales bacterium]
MRGRAYTLLVQRDGVLESRTLRIPVWLVRAATGAAIAVGLGLVTALVLWGPIVRAAAQVPLLERQVARLQAENAKIVQLSAAVDSLEQRYVQVRRMLGADIVPDPVEHRSPLPVAPAIRARLAATLPAGDTGGTPRHWPLDESAFVTRGQVGDTARDEAHPGLDLAVPVGSPVRAAGSGTVAQTGTDPEYGEFVLLQHPDSYETMYGHLSRPLVRAGIAVQAGQVIGLSGNSGRSTAPHLHFEIRRQGVSLDPLTLVKDDRQ